MRFFCCCWNNFFCGFMEKISTTFLHVWSKVKTLRIKTIATKNDDRARCSPDRDYWKSTIMYTHVNNSISCFGWNYLIKKVWLFWLADIFQTHVEWYSRNQKNLIRLFSQPQLNQNSTQPNITKFGFDNTMTLRRHLHHHQPRTH